MAKTKIAFWVSTGIIFLFAGVMTALTSHTEMARTGISQLGYPAYFGVLLAIFKVLGSIALILPMIPRRVKEWAYAGFGFDSIFAFLSIWIIGGFGTGLIMPVIFFLVLAVSYTTYHKLH